MRTYNTPEPISVVIELGVADVQITATDRRDTMVDVRPTNPANKADVAAAEQTTIDFVDGRIFVTAPKGWLHWVPRSGRGSIDVRIDVPTESNVEGSVGVGALRCVGRIGECRGKAGVGDVLIEECTTVTIAVGAGAVEVGYAHGDVEVKTTGAVRLGTIEGGAVIKTSNGDTAIREVAGDPRVTGANGNVVIEQAHGSVQAKSANGDIRLDSAERGTIGAVTARGKVQIGVREGVAAWLDLETGFGRVRNELSTAGEPGPGDETIDVRARTAFGDITIRRAPASTTDAA